MINIAAFNAANAATANQMSDGIGHIILVRRHGSTRTIDMGSVFDFTGTRTAEKNDIKTPPRNIGGAPTTIRSSITGKTIQDSFSTYTLDGDILSLHQGTGYEIEPGLTGYFNSDTGEVNAVYMHIESTGPGMEVRITLRPFVELTGAGVDNGPPIASKFEVTERFTADYTPPANIAAHPKFATVNGGITVTVEAEQAAEVAEALWTSTLTFNPGA